MKPPSSDELIRSQMLSRSKIDSLEADELLSQSKAMAAPRVLVVTGLTARPLGPLLKALRNEDLSVRELERKTRNTEDESFITMLADGDYQACIIPGLGWHTPQQPCSPFADEEWMHKLTSWVSTGGVLLLQAEPESLETWFGLPWQMEIVTDFFGQAPFVKNSGCPLLIGCNDRLPPVCAPRPCVLRGVPLEQCVYGPAPKNSTQGETICAVAAAVFGQGKVISWGGLGCDDETCKILVQLAVHFLMRARPTATARVVNPAVASIDEGLGSATAAGNGDAAASNGDAAETAERPQGVISSSSKTQSAVVAENPGGPVKPWMMGSVCVLTTNGSDTTDGRAAKVAEKQSGAKLSQRTGLQPSNSSIQPSTSGEMIVYQEPHERRPDSNVAKVFGAFSKLFQPLAMLFPGGKRAPAADAGASSASTTVARQRTEAQKVSFSGRQPGLHAELQPTQRVPATTKSDGVEAGQLASPPAALLQPLMTFEKPPEYSRLLQETKVWLRLAKQQRLGQQPAESPQCAEALLKSRTAQLEERNSETTSPPSPPPKQTVPQATQHSLQLQQCDEAGLQSMAAALEKLCTGTVARHALDQANLGETQLRNGAQQQVCDEIREHTLAPQQDQQVGQLVQAQQKQALTNLKAQLAAQMLAVQGAKHEVQQLHEAVLEQDTRVQQLQQKTGRLQQHKQVQQLVQQLQKQTGQLQLCEQDKQTWLKKAEQQLVQLQEALMILEFKQQQKQEEQQISKPQAQAELERQRKQGEQQQHKETEEQPKCAEQHPYPRLAGQVPQPKQAEQQPQPKQAEQQLQPKQAEQQPQPKQAEQQLQPKQAEQQPQPKQAKRQPQSNQAAQQPQPKQAAQQPRLIQAEQQQQPKQAEHQPQPKQAEQKPQRKQTKQQHQPNKKRRLPLAGDQDAAQPRSQAEEQLRLVEQQALKAEKELLESEEKEERQKHLKLAEQQALKAAAELLENEAKEERRKEAEEAKKRVKKAFGKEKKAAERFEAVQAAREKAEAEQRGKDERERKACEAWERLAREKEASEEQAREQAQLALRWSSDSGERDRCEAQQRLAREEVQANDEILAYQEREMADCKREILAYQERERLARNMADAANFTSYPLAITAAAKPETLPAPKDKVSRPARQGAANVITISPAAITTTAKPDAHPAPSGKLGKPILKDATNVITRDHPAIPTTVKPQDPPAARGQTDWPALGQVIIVSTTNPTAISTSVMPEAPLAPMDATNWPALGEASDTSTNDPAAISTTVKPEAASAHGVTTLPGDQRTNPALGEATNTPPGCETTLSTLAALLVPSIPATRLEPLSQLPSPPPRAVGHCHRAAAALPASPPIFIFPNGPVPAPEQPLHQGDRLWLWPSTSDVPRLTPVARLLLTRVATDQLAPALPVPAASLSRRVTPVPPMQNPVVPPTAPWTALPILTTIQEEVPMQNFLLEAAWEPDSPRPPLSRAMPHELTRVLAPELPSGVMAPASGTVPLPSALILARAGRTAAAMPVNVASATSTTARESDECVMCMEEEGGKLQRRFVTFAPCGHRVVCDACVTTFVACQFPCGICQARVDSYT